MLKLIAILFFIGENKAQIVDILAKNSANKSKLQKLQDKYKKKHDKVAVAVAVFFISYPSLLIALHYAVDFFGTQTILSVEKLEMLKFYRHSFKKTSSFILQLWVGSLFRFVTWSPVKKAPDWLRERSGTKII